MARWIHRVDQGMNAKYKCLVKENSGNEASSQSWVFPWKDGDASGVDLWEHILKAILVSFYSEADSSRWHGPKPLTFSSTVASKVPGAISLISTFTGEQ